MSKSTKAGLLFLIWAAVSIALAMHETRFETWLSGVAFGFAVVHLIKLVLLAGAPK